MIQSDFTGPVCLYKLLEPRIKQNPSFLARNIYLTRKKRPSSPSGFNISIDVQKKISSHLSFFLVAEITDNASTSARYKYRIIDSKFVISEISHTFIASFEYPSLNSIPLKSDQNISSFLIFLMHSNDTNTAETDFHRANSLCHKLSSFNWEELSSDEVSLKLKCLLCFVDIKSSFINLKQYRSLSSVSTASIHLPSFRSYFCPLSSVPPSNAASFSSVHDLSNNFILSSRFQCRLYNMKEVEEEDIPFSFFIDDGRNSAKITGAAGSSLKGADNKKRSRDGRLSEKRSRSSTSVNYHILLRIKPKPNVKYVEFFCQSYSHLTCLWCDFTVNKRVSPHYDNNTKKLQPSSALALWELHQHLSCCHYHFSNKIWLSEDGNIHIYVSRPESLLSNSSTSNYSSNDDPPSLIKNRNVYLSLKASKLNTKNIFEQLWSKENPITLNKVFTEYYHSTTGLPVSVTDLNYNSDDEDVDNASSIKFKNSIIDEFTDITKHEKELMKIWNLHLSTFPPHGDRLLPIICQRFVIKYGHILLEKGLRHNLLLHFMNMWDFGLLVAEEIYQYMNYIDNITSMNNNDNYKKICLPTNE
jgi:hypothetical protein